MSEEQNSHSIFFCGTKINYGHQYLIGTKCVLHLKFNGIFPTTHFEKPKVLRTGLLVDGIEAGAIVKVPTISIFLVEIIDSMDAEFKEFMNYGIFKAMQKNSESFMEHTQEKTLIMEKNSEYMIDSEEEKRYFFANQEKMGEEPEALQRNIISLHFPFIEEVVQVVVEVRSTFYLYF
jgi:hypothetical protein